MPKCRPCHGFCNHVPFQPSPSPHLGCITGMGHLWASASIRAPPNHLRFSDEGPKFSMNYPDWAHILPGGGRGSVYHGRNPGIVRVGIPARESLGITSAQYLRSWYRVWNRIRQSPKRLPKCLESPECCRSSAQAKNAAVFLALIPAALDSGYARSFLLE